MSKMYLVTLSSGTVITLTAERYDWKERETKVMGTIVMRSYVEFSSGDSKKPEAWFYDDELAGIVSQPYNPKKL